MFPQKIELLEVKKQSATHRKYIESRQAPPPPFSPETPVTPPPQRVGGKGSRPGEKTRGRGLAVRNLIERNLWN
jgi:hypothetical protein